MREPLLTNHGWTALPATHNFRIIVKVAGNGAGMPMSSVPRNWSVSPWLMAFGTSPVLPLLVLYLVLRPPMWAFHHWMQAILFGLCCVFALDSWFQTVGRRGRVPVYLWAQLWLGVITTTFWLWRLPWQYTTVTTVLVLQWFLVDYSKRTRQRAEASASESRDP